MPHPRAALFDAFGTVFDTDSPLRRHAGRIGPDWPAISREWRALTLQYTWVRSLAGRHRPFSALSREALDVTAALHGLDAALADDIARENRTLDAYPTSPPRSPACATPAWPARSCPTARPTAWPARSRPPPRVRRPAQRGGRRHLQARPARLRPRPRALRLRGRGDRLRVLQPVGRVRRRDVRFPGVLDQPPRPPGGVRPRRLRHDPAGLDGLADALLGSPA